MTANTNAPPGQDISIVKLVPRKKHFGTWNEAIVAAGLKPERRRFTDKEILGMIRARYEAGESLSSQHPDCRNLAVLTCNRFGTWRKGLSAAGVVQFGRKRRTA